MLELYNDKLIDLFAKPGQSDDVSITTLHLGAIQRHVLTLYSIVYF